MVEFAFALPVDSVKIDQRDARDAAYVLDARIRGAVMQFKFWEPRDLSISYLQTTDRGALNPGPDGYGSFLSLVIMSTYRVKRLASLTGGSA